MNVTKILRSIGLEELVERAPLLTRVDRKYLVPVTLLPTVLCGLSRSARVLDIDGRREFDYHSRYFDTPGLDCYLAAAHRRRRRFKVRVRGYLDTGEHFLEVKTRGPRGSTVKQRTPYRDGLVDDDARTFITSALSRTGIPPVGGRLEPALTTRYQRSTLFLPETGSRVTIDTGLAWALPSGPALRLDHRAIVETKSPRGVSDVDRLLWSLRHRPCPVSKYGTGLAALRGELPAHHWQRVLRRHFGL